MKRLRPFLKANTDSQLLATDDVRPEDREDEEEDEEEYEEEVTHAFIKKYIQSLI